MQLGSFRTCKSGGLFQFVCEACYLLSFYVVHFNQ